MFRVVLRNGFRVVGNNGVRKFSSFPEHTVLRMPALSPTMTEGGIANWNVEEGDAIQAGQPICEVETDKASVDFEAVDDGFLAKILVPAGTSAVQVGEPIGVSVEDETTLGEFGSFTLADAGGAPVEAKVEAEAAQPEPVAMAKPEPVAVPKPEPVAVPKPEPVAVPKPEPVAVPKPEPVAATSNVKFPKLKSPLASFLEKTQAEYESTYGITLMCREKPVNP